MKPTKYIIKPAVDYVWVDPSDFEDTIQSFSTYSDWEATWEVNSYSDID